MAQDTAKEFSEGIYFKEKTPEFIVLGISLNREQLTKWLSTKTEEWINIDVKTGKSGKLYGEVNNWKPDSKPDVPVQNIAGMKDDIPF